MNSLAEKWFLYAAGWKNQRQIDVVILRPIFDMRHQKTGNRRLECIQFLLIFFLFDNQNALNQKV